MKYSKRQHLTAVSVNGGIIHLIGPTGAIEVYRQRGIGRLSNEDKQHAIKAGLLDPQAMNLNELPAHYSIEFEDEEVMGKAKATFSIPKIKV